MDRLRVALVGYGLAGRFFHRPLVQATPGLELGAVVTRDAGRAAEVAADVPTAEVVGSVDHLWSRRDIDVVVVASVPGSHAPIASAAVDAGVAVVVEKPLGVSGGEARLLVDRATARGVTLVPFHNRRWDSDQLTLRRLMDDGSLGEVQRYESRFERWRPQASPSAWREATAGAEGGGVLLDLGVHLVDQALHLFGPVVHVHAEVAARRDGADDDVFIALEHASRVVSHLWASAVSAAPGPRLRVLGSGGAYVVDHLDGQEDALRAGERPGQPGFGVEKEERWGRLMHGDRGDPVPSEPGRWLDFYAGLERSLRTGSAPPVAAEEGVAALLVLDEARRVAQAHGDQETAAR